MKELVANSWATADRRNLHIKEERRNVCHLVDRRPDLVGVEQSSHTSVAVQLTPGVVADDRLLELNVN